jgi:hypothetical protein
MKVKRPTGWLSSEAYDAHWVQYHLQQTKPGPNGCLLYTGYVHPLGYATTTYHNRQVKVHRKLFELVKKIKLDRWESICHKCDVRHCINMKRLWKGDYMENNLDMVAKGRHYYASVTHCKSGHEFTPENTAYVKWKKYRFRHCRKCQLIRYRLKMGWTEEEAKTLPIIPKGYNRYGQARS